MAQFFDTSFAVDPETGANQRSFMGVSMVPLEPLPNPDDDSRMQKFV
jgi:hypothetical protein